MGQHSPGRKAKSHKVDGDQGPAVEDAVASGELLDSEAAAADKKT